MEYLVLMKGFIIELLIGYFPLHFLMTMKASLARQLAAYALWGVAPAMALPPLDEFVTEQQGAIQRWLNWTSTHYDIDWINEEHASKHYISK